MFVFLPSLSSMQIAIWFVWIYHIFPRFLINGTNLGKRLFNLKHVFRFSLQPLSETFLSLRSVLRDTVVNVRGVADKSLTRPRRKQATAKLGIYSTYSPWSSIPFLARCSNFCKPLRKNSEFCPSNQVSAAAMTSASDEKWRTFTCFSVQGAGGSPTGPDPENRVGDQDIESPVRPVCSVLQVPGEPWYYRARTRPPW